MDEEFADLNSGPLDLWKSEAERRSFFAAALMNPAFHWFFTQGQEALERELYIPGVSSLLIGIEASLRVTVAQLADDYDGELRLSRHQVLSNPLLRKAGELGLPIDALAFPNEADFADRLLEKEPVRIVRLRHDVCHGNILDFIEEMEFEGIKLLTPECLRPVAAQLLGIAYEWADQLAKFRDNHGRRPKGLPMPVIPANPLGKWLPKG